MNSPGKITPSDSDLPPRPHTSPIQVFFSQPMALFICCLEEPRMNLVHTTAVLAAILFRSIPSSLQAGATVTFTMVLPLAQARKDNSATLSVCGLISVFTGIDYNTSRTQPRIFFSVAHVTNPISGISSECSIFFIEDSFYTHQSFIARLYILYIIYIKYIYIYPYAKVLHASIFSKLETSFLIYKQVPTFLFFCL